ncbi:MAG: hypothetical protein LH618_00195 [Saprospiraceae bacterium]|nr:hypothetical protein [Saprospiraceae bacterium]
MRTRRLRQPGQRLYIQASKFPPLRKFEQNGQTVPVTNGGSGFFDKFMVTIQPL